MSMLCPVWIPQYGNVWKNLLVVILRLLSAGFGGGVILTSMWIFMADSGTPWAKFAAKMVAVQCLLLLAYGITGCFILLLLSLSILFSVAFAGSGPFLQFSMMLIISVSCSIVLTIQADQREDLAGRSDAFNPTNVVTTYEY